MTKDETQPLEKEPEKRQPFQFAKWTFRVLFSPTKTFEEIVKQPNIKGPILILLITLPILLSGQLVSGEKFFLEVPVPENDLWTEPSATSSFLWTSNDNVTYDGENSISGNYSVSASLISSSSIWMHLTKIGSLNCSEKEYDHLFFRIKWINEANITPTATLRLFSFHNDSTGFEFDLSNAVANSTNSWANVSVILDTDGWTAIPGSFASWENVTGVGFQLVWNDPANISLKIDDFFFGKYVPLSSFETYSIQLLYSLVRGGVNYLLEWIILSGIVLLALRSFSEWKGTWKNLLSIVGYIYSASIVYSCLLTLLFLFLPPIFIRSNITYSEYLDIYQSSWGLPISLLSLFSYGWTIVLCTIAVKRIHELSWNRASLISIGAFMMSLLFSSFLLSLIP